MGSVVNGQKRCGRSGGAPLRRTTDWLVSRSAPSPRRAQASRPIKHMVMSDMHANPGIHVRGPLRQKSDGPPRTSTEAVPRRRAAPGTRDRRTSRSDGRLARLTGSPCSPRKVGQSGAGRQRLAVAQQRRVTAVCSGSARCPRLHDGPLSASGRLAELYVASNASFCVAGRADPGRRSWPAGARRRRGLVWPQASRPKPRRQAGGPARHG